MQWNAASDDWRTTKSTVSLREGGSFTSRMEAKDGHRSPDSVGYTVLPLGGSFRARLQVDDPSPCLFGFAPGTNSLGNFGGCHESKRTMGSTGSDHVKYLACNDIASNW
jgi:hypothetical protein